MIHTRIKSVILIIFISFISCTHSTYLVSSACLDTTRNKVILNQGAKERIEFGYDPFIDPERFVYPLQCDTIIEKINVRSDFILFNLKDTGLTSKDSLIYLNPFAATYIVNSAAVTDFDNIVDYSNYILEGSIVEYTANNYYDSTDSWLVFQKISAFHNKQLLLVRYYIPYKGKFLCVCYIIHGRTKRNDHITPRIFLTNYDPTSQKNIAYVSRIIESCNEDIAKIIIQIKRTAL